MNDIVDAREADRLYRLLKPYFPGYAASLDRGRGTAFPTTGIDGGALVAGERFFRTDIGMACYYDGSRWLTINDYPYVVLPWQTFSVTNTLVDIVIRTDYAVAITRTITATNVTAPNSGAAFWTIIVAGINTARSASTTIETFNTSADTAGVETLRDNTPNSSTLPTNRTYIRCIGSKTGAPGNMTIAHTTYARLVIP